MPTAAQPYGAPRMGMATPTSTLPPLGQGAFPAAGGYSQCLFGIPQMAEGGRPTGPTIVGERGPEIFVPDVHGAIVPMNAGANVPLPRPGPHREFQDDMQALANLFGGAR